MTSTSVQRKFWIVLMISIFIIASATLVNGQTVSGTVRSATDNRPLVGVTVQVSNSGQGTVTNSQGQYQLTGLSATDTLVFSFIGYESILQVVGNKKQINVALKPTASSLDQLIVIGYGTEKRSSITSAITRVENESLDQIPAQNIGTALKGRMPGVQISSHSNVPGASPTIRIRGTGSISASNSPLIVIDGFPGGSLSTLNMNDVASIEVLKDASAAAIYGSRGANGVIIVTTKKGKKGKKGKPKLNFNAYYGISKPKLHDDWITGEEFYDYQVLYKNRDFYYVGGDTSLPMWGDPRRPAAYQVNPVIKEGDVIWQNVVLRPAPIQSYSLSVSGGSDNLNYYISGSYKDQKGTMLTSWDKLYSLESKFNFKINSFIEGGLKISPTYSKRRIAGGGIHSLAKAGPYVSDKQNPDGSWPKALDYWGTSVSAQVSPLAMLYGTHDYAQSFNTLGSAYLQINIKNNLSFKSSLYANFNYYTHDYYQQPMASTRNQSSGSASGSRSINVVSENVITYNKSFNNSHNLNVTLGASYQKATSRSARMAAFAGTFSNDIIRTLNNATINPTATNTTKTLWGLISYYGRINYNFKNKYLLSASFRRDGSSRFGSDNRWGSFPSVSAGWRVSEEPFFQSLPVISNLKLRASYGIAGNFNIGNFSYVGKIGNAYYSPGNVVTRGQAQSNFGNSKLHWERTHSLDIGINLGLFENRVNVVFDYYDKTTKGLLYSVNIPSITGFSTSLVNVGSIGNKGIELQINTKNLTDILKWETTLNFSKNKNEVIALGGGVNQVLNIDRRGMGWILRVGDPMFSYYGYKLIGVLSEEDIQSDKVSKLPGSQAGNGKYQDTNHDGEITGEDKVILGHSQPDFTIGMVNNFSWKNFDLGFTFQASVGSSIYNQEALYYQGPTVCAIRLSLVDDQWWLPTRPGSAPSTALSQLAYVANSDYYLQNASFLSLRSLVLGYTIPDAFTEKLHISNCRLYLSGENLFMITNNEFTGYNPEGYTQGVIDGINSKPGYNVGSYPISHTFAIGINLTF